jgi:mono/diheme cytochrome c family protein
MSRSSSAAALAAALLLCACADDPAPTLPPGQRLFHSQGCVACHGAGGEGGTLGPPLRGLASNWTRERLAAYLADPQGTVAADARLQELGRRYPMPMPPIPASLAERGELADYVLALK